MTARRVCWPPCWPSTPTCWTTSGAPSLNRLGYHARHASDTGFRLADRLLPLGSDDVVLIMARTRIGAELEVTLHHAAELGARAVLLTDTLGEALRGRTDVVLSVPTGSPETYGGQSMILIVLEALTMAVGAQNQQRAMATFDKRNQLREASDTLIGEKSADANHGRAPGRRLPGRSRWGLRAWQAPFGVLARRRRRPCRRSVAGRRPACVRPRGRAGAPRRPAGALR